MDAALCVGRVRTRPHMLIPLILSGGSGTRLWPVSREAYPKPFIKLPDGQSLLQKTLARLQPLTPIAEVITVTNREHFFATRDEYRRSALDVPHFFVLEPCARNTAPAVATWLRSPGTARR
jgi:mannose-1-phosphate guanylyltransferase / mannose-6-phosphate isomerase